MKEFLLNQLASEVQTAIENALNPDTTMTASGKPVEAAAVGRAISQLSEEIADEFNVINPNIRAVAHRGLSLEAPENTLSAYRMAREKGFTYAECDVAVTADGVPVLLHDDTIDRTSNGTGSITALTFEQVRALDFGSWFSADFAGEKIPTLEEFVIFCKWNGLHPYIEIKENVSADKIPTIVSVVRRYDMLRNVTWISFSSALLEAVKEQDARARLGYVVGGASSAHITWAKSVKTDSNEVFIDVLYSQVTAKYADECAANGIPLEVWTIDSADAMASLDPYVSGFTSDNVRANVALYGAKIPESEVPSSIVMLLRSSGGVGILYAGTNMSRIAVLSTVGTVPYSCDNEAYNNKYYPVAVPTGATSVTMICPDNFKWAVRGRYLTDGVWQNGGDSGWLAQGGGTYALSGITRADYVDLLLEIVPSATIPSDFDTSTIGIEFA